MSRKIPTTFQAHLLAALVKHRRPAKRSGFSWYLTTAEGFPRQLGDTRTVISCLQHGWTWTCGGDDHMASIQAGEPMAVLSGWSAALHQLYGSRVRRSSSLPNSLNLWSRTRMTSPMTSCASSPRRSRSIWRTRHDPPQPLLGLRLPRRASSSVRASAVARFVPASARCLTSNGTPTSRDTQPCASTND